MAKISNVFSKEEVKKSVHPKRITKWIHYTKLVRNDKQYCDAKDKEEIEGLADIIEADGMVLQDLLVKKLDADEYKIIAGHKRHVVQDAWDEQVTTYEDYPWDCCNVCGADCTADPGGHAYQHAIKGEGGGHHTEYDSRPVTKTVHHDAVYGTRWVQDTAAYDETVVDGYVCSCGARK